MTEWVRTFGDVQLEMLVDEALLTISTFRRPSPGWTSPAG